MCLEGEADIIYTENNDKENIKTGETILIPAVLKNINIKPQPKVKILEIYID